MLNLKSLASSLRSLPHFQVGCIDWHSIDFRAHCAFEVRGHLQLPLLLDSLERWIQDDFTTLSCSFFVASVMLCGAL